MATVGDKNPEPTKQGAMPIHGGDCPDGRTRSWPIASRGVTIAQDIPPSPPKYHS